MLSKQRHRREGEWIFCPVPIQLSTQLCSLIFSSTFFLISNYAWWIEVTVTWKLLFHLGSQFEVGTIMESCNTQKQIILKSVAKNIFTLNYCKTLLYISIANIICTCFVENDYYYLGLKRWSTYLLSVTEN